MTITIISVGRLKEDYLVDGIEYYARKIRKNAELRFIEINDEKAPENLSDALMEQIKIKEGKGILNAIHPKMFVITLEILGKELTSAQLKKLINEQSFYQKPELCFVIGGSLGLSQEVSNRSDFKLSFSKMTLPHQLMKLVLTEQISYTWRDQ